jgi:hypothetical protein
VQVFVREKSVQLDIFGIVGGKEGERIIPTRSAKRDRSRLALERQGCDEERLGRILSLPLHPYLDERQIDAVCASFLALLGQVATGAELAAAPGAN